MTTPQPARPRDPDCRCQWSPVRGRLWCKHCLTDGPKPGTLADTTTPKD